MATSASASREMVVALRFQALVDDARKNMNLLRGDMQQLKAANDGTAAATATTATSQAQLEAGVQGVGAAARQTAEALRQEASAAGQATTATRAQAGASQQLSTANEQVAGAARRAAQATQEQSTAAGVAASRLAAQASAASRARAATAQGAAAVDKYGVAAGQTAQAIRMLPMQITDVVTSVASGMPIWMVAIQQGGQIKDSFGGIAPMFSNLLKLLTPVKVGFLGLGAALAGAYLVFRNGEQELQRFNVAVETTGNFAGATREKVETLAEEAKRVSGISRSSARDIAVGLVQAGDLTMEVIANITKSARTYAFATGQEVGAAASTLAQALTDPARAARELDKQLNFLDLAQRQYIDRLVEQGQTEQATLFVSQQLSKHLGTTMVENVGVLQRAWQLFIADLQEAKQLILDIGREPTTEEKITKARETVENARANVLLYGNDATQGAQFRAQLQQAEINLEQMELAKLLADADAEAQSLEAQHSAQRKRSADEAKRIKDRYKTALEEFEEEKKKLDRALADNSMTQEDYDKTVKRMEKRRDEALSRGQPKPRTDKQLQTDLHAIQQPLSNVTGQVDLEAVREALERQYKPAIDAAAKIPGIDVERVKEQVQLIVDAGTAQAEFNDRLADAQRLQADLQLQEAAIRREQQSGAISQVEAEAQLRDARAAQAPELQAIVVELERIRDAVPAEAVGTLQSMGAAIGQVKMQADDATPTIVSLGRKLKTSFIDNISNAAGQAAANFENMGDAIKSTLKNIAGSILSSGIKEALTYVLSGDGGQGGSGFFGAIVSGAKSIFGFAAGGDPGIAVSGSGRAAAGLIRGPGTGTSDSIPAIVDGWQPIAVSSHEYIQPERAVRHYGVQFMEAIRTLRFPKPNVGYALGGLVQAHRAAARFASGGQMNTAATSAAPSLKVEVQLVNQGTPQRVVRQSQQIDQERVFVSLFLDDMRRGGDMSRGVLDLVNKRGR